MIKKNDKYLEIHNCIKFFIGESWKQHLSYKKLNHIYTDHWKQRKWENKMTDMEIIKQVLTFKIKIFLKLKDKIIGIERK